MLVKVEDVDGLATIDGLDSVVEAVDRVGRRVAGVRIVRPVLLHGLPYGIWLEPHTSPLSVVLAGGAAVFILKID